jgi:hypothetical protein
MCTGRALAALGFHSPEQIKQIVGDANTLGLAPRWIWGACSRPKAVRRQFAILESPDPAKPLVKIGPWRRRPQSLLNRSRR